MPSCVALIVAAGSGERFGGPRPKQYQNLAGVSILRRSVLAFLNHPHINTVYVVINPKHRDWYDDAVGDLNLPPPIHGGASRQESVRLGLESIVADGKTYHSVLIHDAARPLIDAKTITAVHAALSTTPGAIAAKPLVDTLKRGDAGQAITATLDRTNLWQAHTPQGFHFHAIVEAHRQTAGSQLTDDAAVAEQAGLSVTLIPSNPDNMKITNPDDLDRATRLLGQGHNDIRTGMGFDVHRFEPGDKIILGGVAIPHDRKLEGHSDADAILHALVDAMLGTVGAGDIGTFFPPSDPQWKGADSSLFVRHALGLITEHGGIINNVDITIMSETPRIGPHRLAMVARIAELLEVEPTRVNVKATTTERLGFTGREEGLAAHAIVTIRFPG